MKKVKFEPFKVLVWILMAVFALSFVLLFFWMVMSSFRDAFRFGENSLNVFDLKNFSFDGFKVVLGNEMQESTGFSFVRLLFNSLVLILIYISSALLFPPMVGYTLAKYNFKGKKLIYLFIILTMTVPGIGTTLATYQFIVGKLHLLNNWLSVIILQTSGIGFGALLYANYFGGLPHDYVESAYVDGAGEFTIYFKIMYPQAKPLLITMAILAFIGGWNDYMVSFLYLPDKPTIAYGINELTSYYIAQQSYPTVFAALIVCSIIPLIIYGLFSDTIMSSVSVGGIKG